MDPSYSTFSTKHFIILLQKYQHACGIIKIALIFFSENVKTWKKKKEHQVKEMFFTPNPQSLEERSHIYIYTDNTQNPRYS